MQPASPGAIMRTSFISKGLEEGIHAQHLCRRRWFDDGDRPGDVPGSAQAPLHDASIPTPTSPTGRRCTARCVTCHGTQGDAIGGVNLRSGKFRNAVIDRDLERFIRTGSPAGMPAFALDTAEMAGIIAYLRNMNAFDAAAVKTGDVARGRGVFDGKGALHGVPSRRRRRVARRART